jgi:hypothetical protein
MCQCPFSVLIRTLFLGSLLTLPTLGRDDPPIFTKKELRTASNNLKQIALANLNFESAYGYLPGDIVDKAGKPLLSWRVAILPYLDQTDLYNSFKMDEPWDSPTNKKLIEKIPKTYTPVRGKAKAGETFCQVFVGENTLFGPNKKPKIVSITDGTSNTGSVFEAGDPVIWTKPADLPFDEKKPLPKLGGMFDGEFHVAMCDGSVRLLKKNPDEQQLKYLIMPADGNIIDFKKLEN